MASPNQEVPLMHKLYRVQMREVISSYDINHLYQTLADVKASCKDKNSFYYNITVDEIKLRIKQLTQS
jgi:hypothetical protein